MHTYVKACQLIAKILQGIAEEDLTTAEKQIKQVLDDTYPQEKQKMKPKEHEVLKG